MTRCIFWKDGEVLITERVWAEEARQRALSGYLCVDETHTTPTARYGMFHLAKDWRHVPLEEFPKEFRMHLLLLGVG